MDAVGIVFDSLGPPCQELRSRRANGPDLRRLMSLGTDAGWDIHAVSSAQPIILQISGLPGVLHRLASGRRIGDPPTSGCSISSGTVTGHRNRRAP